MIQPYIIRLVEKLCAKCIGVSVIDGGVWCHHCNAEAVSLSSLKHDSWCVVTEAQHWIAQQTPAEVDV